jgi:hypothetical protein
MDIKKLITVIVQLLDFWPDLKTKLGAIMQVLVAVAVAYNGIAEQAASIMQLPAISMSVLAIMQLGASTLVAVGTANAQIRLQVKK